MRYHEDQAIARQIAQQLDDGRGRVGIQISRRLVCQNDARIFDDGTRDRNPLPLTAAQFARVAVTVAGKIHLLQRRADAVPVLHAAKIQREQNVLKDRQLINQVIVLKDKADVRVAVIAEILLAEGGQIVAVHKDPALGNAVKTADEVEERGFSATAFAKDKHQPRIGQSQVHLVQRAANAPVPRAIDLRQIGNVDHDRPPNPFFFASGCDASFLFIIAYFYGL